MSWKQSILTVAGFAFLALPGSAQMGSAVPRLNRDALLLGFIHQANQAEIEMANLAKDNSGSKRVKKFADRLLRDHRRADIQVLTLAKNQNIDLVATRNQAAALRDIRADERQSRSVGSETGEYVRSAQGTGGSTGPDETQVLAEHNATMEKLRDLKRADFDREFTSAMVKDHQMVVDRLTTARPKIKDPETQSLVDQLLPTLKHHLSMAQKLQDNLPKS